MARSLRDIAPGAEVLLTDESGDIIAKGRLEVPFPDFDLDRNLCIFEFQLLDVPDAKFYTLSVAKRDGPTLSIYELVAMGWKVDLSID